MIAVRYQSLLSENRQEAGGCHETTYTSESATSPTYGHPLTTPLLHLLTTRNLERVNIAKVPGAFSSTWRKRLTSMNTAGDKNEAHLALRIRATMSARAFRRSSWSYPSQYTVRIMHPIRDDAASRNKRGARQTFFMFFQSDGVNVGAQSCVSCITMCPGQQSVGTMFRA